MRELLVILGLSLVGLCLAQNDVIVDTVYGQVSGKARTIHTGSVINRFYGIPFAKAPIGKLRWQPPEDPEPFDGVFDANRLPTVCPQGLGLLAITHPFYQNIGEDCLNLNIFAPNDTSGGPYPVMMWIHGGGYTGSGNVQYPGYFLADKGVVSVVINYRLGHLGFMSSGDDAAQGNYGLMDQIKALEFIRDNIANFGGDPNKVTVFGQSAGASSGSLLQLSPRAKGLFHQVIAESGNDLIFWAFMGPDQKPSDYTREVAGKLGCPTDDSYAMMDCLREVDAETLRSTSFTCKDGYFCQGFAPVVDGDILPDIPARLRERGEYTPVPMIAGQCSDDGSLYTVTLVPDSEDGGFSRERFEELLRTNLISIFQAQFPDHVEDVFEAIDFYYSMWPYRDDPDANREAFNVMITDVGFGAYGDYQIKDQSKYQDVYYYILAYRSSKAAAIVPEWMGVPHNGEIPYVLGWPFLKLNPALRLDTGILFDVIQWDEEDQEWGDYITTLWTNFAKYGNPTPEPVTAPGENEATVWPRWRSEEQNYLMLDRQVENLLNYRQRNFAFWFEYLMYVTGLNYPRSQGTTPARRTTPSGPGRRLYSDEVSGRLDNFYRKMAHKALAVHFDS